MNKRDVGYPNTVPKTPGRAGPEVCAVQFGSISKGKKCGIEFTMR